MLGNTQKLIYEFNKNSKSDWNIVDDIVMGGRSNGGFSVNKDGHGVFSGDVSLENNGGFSSVRHHLPETLNLSKYTHVKLKLKGDGSYYQFRLKEGAYDRHSYKKEFETTGRWQEIDLAFKDFIPTFRGRTLDMPEFNGEKLSDITFLIGNKKAQRFELEVEWIKAY